MIDKGTANRMREIRKQKGLSIRSVAEQLGLSYSSMSKYEYGLRTPLDSTKVKIANFYGVTVEEIFFADKYHENE